MKITQNGNRIKQAQDQVDNWGKYLKTIPQEVVQQRFITEKSVFIYNLQTILLKAYKKNKTTGKRVGLEVPTEEFKKYYPKNAHYLITRFRDLGLALRVRQNIDRSFVYVYIDGYSAKFKKLQKGKINDKKI